ncbi:MAG: hypothetical protein LBE12_10410 [Planctomycetaceae bacterium]|nr:hypothetical protein [Planctomycetaceae bacterium]
MRNYCRLGSDPLATLSTIHYQLSTISPTLLLIAPTGRIGTQLTQNKKESASIHRLIT